jgi:hypothetical protein
MSGPSSLPCPDCRGVLTIHHDESMPRVSHTLPSCTSFDFVTDLDDMEDLLERARKKAQAEQYAAAVGGSR